jgi:hypothetical protein
MPYFVKRKGKKWAVVDDKGKEMGEHESEEKARKQQAALNINVASKEAKMDGAKSLSDLVSQVRQAFEKKFERYGPNGEYIGGRYCREIYEDRVVVEWDGDELYAIPYVVENGQIKFSEPDAWQKVEKAYVPVSESLRIVAARKKDGEAEGREWEVVIIGPETDADLISEGQETYIRSKNGRLYNAAALEASLALWDGVKVYDNHLTDAEMEQKQGMRSVVNEWVGVIVQPAWDATRKAVTGVLKVVDEKLREKLVNADKAGVLNAIGLSIDALGEGAEMQVAGMVTPVVTKIARAMSVDVVADPAAGGRLSRMIAGMSPLQINQSTEEVEMDPEELKKLIGDSVSAALAGFDERLKVIESRAAQQEDQPEEETPGQEEPAEVPAAVQEAVRKAEELVRQADEKAKQAECAHMLGLKLQESGLPESYRELVAKQFRGKVFEAAALDAAIKEHREALAKLSESGQVILPAGSRINVSPVTELDRYALSFLRLVAGATMFNQLATRENAQYHGFDALQRYVEAGRPAIPQARRLSEWYYEFTNDLDGVGIFANPRLREANVTSSMLTSIVKNTINLLLAADYSVREQWWAPVVRQEDVDTLDAATLVRVYGVSNLAEISEGAAYVETSWSDEEETASYVKRGNYIGVTLETFLLDKLNTIRSLPTRLSNAWYNTVSALVSAVFTVNTATGPALADTGALFNATAVTTAGGHANLGTTALSYASFVAARTAMMKQTDQPLGVGRRLNIRPKYLLVPVDLLATAEQIRNSELVPSQDAVTTATAEFQTQNSVKGQFEIITVPDWTDTNNWAAMADPVQFPAVHLIWLRGRRTPELFSAEDERGGAMFTNDELRFKVRQFGFRYSSTYDCAPVSDFRPLYKANVA